MLKKKIRLGLALACEGGGEVLAASSVESNPPLARFCAWGGGEVMVASGVEKIHIGLALASEGGREALAASNVETNLPPARFCTRECGGATSDATC